MSIPAQPLALVRGLSGAAGAHARPRTRKGRLRGRNGRQGRGSAGAGYLAGSSRGRSIFGPQASTKSGKAATQAAADACRAMLRGTAGANMETASSAKLLLALRRRFCSLLDRWQIRPRNLREIGVGHAFPLCNPADDCLQHPLQKMTFRRAEFRGDAVRLSRVCPAPVRRQLTDLVENPLVDIVQFGRGGARAFPTSGGGFKDSQAKVRHAGQRLAAGAITQVSLMHGSGVRRPD